MIKCKVTKKNYAGTRNCNGLFNRAGDNADCRMCCYNRHVAFAVAGAENQH